ncbi:MAG: dTDP-4-dehydrorhamnose reductase [bacterium]|jgi:dTDP-4-dehydrorhamnose reductase|nr:dTDP-4-dehydrorhamnose reductase [bacterium]
MKILITGANGQLGTELHEILEREFPGQTLYTDVQELDLTNAKAVDSYVANNEITHIVNCAAYTAVDRAEEEKMLCAAVNTDAVKNLAMAADANGAKIIHISTDYVFDGTNHRPYRESDKVNPISQYGTTKRKGETLLLALAPQAIIIRTAWLYSAHGNNFVKTMLRLADSQPEIKVVCDQIGTPTFARDLARAVVKVLQSHQWVPGIYHFTDEGAASWYDFAKAIFRIAGKDVKVTPIPTEDYPTPASRPSYSILDRTRIKATYGIEIPHWEEALADCLRQLGY